MVNRLIVRHALLIIVLMNVNFKTKINTTKERKLFCEINKSKSGSKTGAGNASLRRGSPDGTCEVYRRCLLTVEGEGFGG